MSRETRPSGLQLTRMRPDVSHNPVGDVSIRTAFNAANQLVSDGLLLRVEKPSNKQ